MAYAGVVRSLFSWLACAAFVLLSIPAEAQPAGRTIKLIYGFAAGNSGDGVTRILADQLRSRVGTPVVVENRPGASGRLATKAAIAADPDGTTLLLAPLGPIALHSLVYSNLDFNPLLELAPLSQIATFDTALVISANVAVRTAPELVAWLIANPDKGTYGTPGLGGLPHFFAVMFAGSAKVTLRNVPYRGGAAVLNDLVSGQLPIAFIATSDAVGLTGSGKVKVLATSGRQRTPFIPGVPTFKEAGYDIEGEGWYGLYAPVKTPTDILARLSDAAREAMNEPSVRERVRKLGLVPTGTTADELRRIQTADRQLWAPAIRASGFKPSD